MGPDQIQMAAPGGLDGGSERPQTRGLPADGFVGLPTEERHHMRMSRASIVTLFLALAFVVVLAARFSATSSSDAVVYDQARDLQQAVSQAVAATNDVVIGAAQPQFAASAIDQASSASRQLAETRVRLESAQLRTLATQMVSAADQVLAQLSRGAIDRAEELRANRLVPIASEIAQLKRTQPEITDENGWVTGASRALAVALVLVVVWGVAATLTRGRNRPKAPAGSNDPDRNAPDGAKEHRSDRGWSDPHPLYGDAELGEAEIDNSDDARATRMRPIEVELRSLLESTIEQARDREWSVDLVCPEVHISGDPIRVSRTILAVLGTAYLEGARRVGIVVEAPDDLVRLSIGHDAPIDDATAEHIAVRLESQLANALGMDELGWSVTSDGEITLTTVPLGISVLARAGAEITA